MYLDIDEEYLGRRHFWPWKPLPQKPHQQVHPKLKFLQRRTQQVPWTMQGKDRCDHSQNFCSVLLHWITSRRFHLLPQARGSISWESQWSKVPDITSTLITFLKIKEEQTISFRQSYDSCLQLLKLPTEAHAVNLSAGLHSRLLLLKLNVVRALAAEKDSQK